VPHIFWRFDRYQRNFGPQECCPGITVLAIGFDQQEALVYTRAHDRQGIMLGVTPGRMDDSAGRPVLCPFGAYPVARPGALEVVIAEDQKHWAAAIVQKGFGDRGIAARFDKIDYARPDGTVRRNSMGRIGRCECDEPVNLIMRGHSEIAIHVATARI
jgi:hypothetical protein